MTTPDPTRVVRDATWLAHRYDAESDRIQFVHVDREAHRAATFLTDDNLRTAQRRVAVPRAQARAMSPEASPLHFIFHSAFCCSTLMVRAADLPGVAMGLKEPVILNDLSGWARRGAAGADVARVLDDALALLARPFTPGEMIVVKPSNVINAFAPAMLGMRSGARALLLYAPLRTYLASIAKKGMEGRLWVRDLFRKLARDGLIDFGFSTEDYFGQTDLQIAAIGWLAQQALFDGMIRQFGPGRVLPLDSETLVTRPREATSAMYRLFGRPLAQAELDSIIDRGTFSRHSKLDVAFDRRDRLAEHDAAVSAHAAEVDMVAQWADLIAQQRGIPLRLTPSAFD